MVLTQNRADRIILSNISWKQFENLLVDLGDKRTVRIAYDREILEIMSPLAEHEYYKERISDVIKDVAEILAIDCECFGSATWKKETQLAGLESDNCFYLQNEPLIRGKLVFDLNFDPPPDLALEIDITSKSLNRFPIYARLGVPEIWCYDSGQLKIYILSGNVYIEQTSSLVFPGLRLQEIPSLIEEYRSSGRNSFRKAIRLWAQSQISR
jgi:Uma2 family endonuclease